MRDGRHVDQHQQQTKLDAYGNDQQRIRAQVYGPYRAFDAPAGERAGSLAQGDSGERRARCRQ